MAQHVLWPDPVTPDNADPTNPGGIVTGTGVLVGAGGSIVGVRFWSSSTVSGSYKVSLWSLNAGTQAAGTLLVSKSFTSASVTAGAFTTVLFDSPISVSSAQAYVVGLWSADGHFVSSIGTFNGGNFVGGLATVYAWAHNENISPSAPNWTTMGQAVFAETDTLPFTSNGNAYFVSPVWDDGAEEHSGTAAVGITLTLAASGRKRGKGSAAFALNLSLAAPSAVIEPGNPLTASGSNPSGLAAGSSASTLVASGRP